MALLRSFHTYFGLVVALKIFSSVEEVARALQKKDITADAVQSNLSLLQKHLESMRNEEFFHRIFDEASTNSPNFVNEPTLPRHRKIPKKIDGGLMEAHKFQDAETYHRGRFYEILDLILSEIGRRFDQPTLKFLSNLEETLFKSVNGMPIDYKYVKKLVKDYPEIDSERLQYYLSWQFFLKY